MTVFNSKWIQVCDKWRRSRSIQFFTFLTVISFYLKYYFQKTSYKTTKKNFSGGLTAIRQHFLRKYVKPHQINRDTFLKNALSVTNAKIKKLSETATKIKQ